MKTNANAIIVALAVIIAAYLFSNAFKNRNQSSDTISVTGLGKKDFVSDLIVWSGSFSKKSVTLKEAYASLDADREKIKGYLASKGINASEIVFSAVNFNKDFDFIYNENSTPELINSLDCLEISSILLTSFDCTVTVCVSVNPVKICCLVLPFSL